MVQFLTSSGLKTMFFDPDFRRYLGVFALCLASISTLVSLGLVGLSFATDNWKHISVNRGNLNKVINSTNIASNSSHDVNHQDLHNEPRYFDRVEGLFRVCFPMAEKPQRHDHDIYLSPLMSEWCTNIEYYVHLIMEDGLVPDKMTINGKIWIHLARSVIASFCLYFAFMAVACFIGLMGCYQMSDTKVIWTASLMMIAFFMGTAGMGLYHAADHYERYKVYDERLAFYQTWPEILKENTRHNFGWSYIMAWFGLLLTLVSSGLMAIAAAAMRSATELMDDDMARQVIVDQTSQALDQFDTDVQRATMRRYGSHAYLGAPMPASVGYYDYDYPPGLTSIPLEHRRDSYIDDNAYRKGIKQQQFSDAQL